MNIKYIEMVARQKLCPVCSVGMTREIGPKLYQCDHSRCGETFDFSQLSDEMLRELLKKKNQKDEAGAAPE